MRAPAGSALNPELGWGEGRIRHAWSLHLLIGEEPLLFGDKGQWSMPGNGCCKQRRKKEKAQAFSIHVRTLGKRVKEGRSHTFLLRHVHCMGPSHLPPRAKMHLTPEIGGYGCLCSCFLASKEAVSILTPTRSCPPEIGRTGGEGQEKETLSYVKLDGLLHVCTCAPPPIKI